MLYNNIVKVEGISLPSLFSFKAALITKYEATNYSIRERQAHDIIDLGLQYIKRTQHYFMEIRDKETYQSMEIPLFNRFSKPYIDSQIEKIYSLHWKHAPDFFLTLTLDFSKFKSIYEGFKELGKEWNRVLAHLKKYDPYIQFIKTQEIQTQNTKNVHLHILFSFSYNLYNRNSKDLKEFLENKILPYIKIGTQEKLKVLHEYFEDKNKRLPSNHELFYMSLKYILKYIKKGFEYNDNPKKLYSYSNQNKFILWALHARTFSFSRSLRHSGKFTMLDFAFKTNSNRIHSILTSYHLKHFYQNMFINFKSHMFYEMEQSKYEFVRIFKLNERFLDNI